MINSKLYIGYDIWNHNQYITKTKTPQCFVFTVHLYESSSNTSYKKNFLFIYIFISTCPRCYFFNEVHQNVLLKTRLTLTTFPPPTTRWMLPRGAAAVQT